MASLASSGFVPLSEEQFDFDVSMSPSSGAEEDEDEVFVGPASHKEKCTAAGIETRMQKDTSSGQSLGEEPSWSPLTEVKFVEISKEANLLAMQIETGIYVKRSMENKADEPAQEAPSEKEAFVEDSGAKLCLFGKLTDPALSPIKRDTFCIQDSPLKQLPPAIKHRLLRTVGTSSPACSSRSSSSTSSPVKVCRAQSNSALRSKAALSQTRLLPNKPAAPGSSRTSTKTKPHALDKGKLVPLEKGKPGWQRSPSRRSLRGASSSEDLLSDGTSVASDVSDCSLNTSLPVKKSIPALRKAGHQRPAPMKAQALHSRIEDRRKTSSSSSSVSSVNSSLSTSPLGKGKQNTSLNLSVNGVRARAPSTVSKLLSSSAGSRSRPSLTALRGADSAAGARKPLELQSRAVKATPSKAEPVHQAPRLLAERSSSLPSIPAASMKSFSVVKGNAKPKGVIVPTPSKQLVGLEKSETVPAPETLKILKPKKLMSAYSLDSQNTVVPEVFQTPSTGTLSQPRARRMSALPTPVSRRVSGIPMLTPKIVLPGKAGEKGRLSASAGRASNGSPVLKVTGEMSSQSEVQSSEEHPGPAQLQPCSLLFSLEDESGDSSGAVPTPGSLESTKQVESLPDQQDTPQGFAENGELSSPDISQHLCPVSVANAVEDSKVLLVDAPAPVLKTEDRLLIDLSNTPDLIKMVPLKSSGQLIDLSSPLITWSPADKKENVMDTAPLINLSF